MPPHMKTDDKVILFDGVCKLCHLWTRFIIQYDTQYVFKLATVQSDEGQAILKHFNMPTDRFDTMLLVDGESAYDKSTAFLNVVRLLPHPFKVVSVFRVIPRVIRDWLYDRIALNRYKIFGKYDQCMMPSASDHEKRFL